MHMGGGVRVCACVLVCLCACVLVCLCVCESVWGAALSLIAPIWIRIAIAAPFRTRLIAWVTCSVAGMACIIDLSPNQHVSINADR